MLLQDRRHEMKYVLWRLAARLNSSFPCIMSMQSARGLELAARAYIHTHTCRRTCPRGALSHVGQIWWSQFVMPSVAISVSFSVYISMTPVASGLVDGSCAIFDARVRARAFINFNLFWILHYLQIPHLLAFCGLNNISSLYWLCLCLCLCVCMTCLLSGFLTIRCRRALCWLRLRKSNKEDYHYKSI